MKRTLLAKSISLVLLCASSMHASSVYAQSEETENTAEEFEVEKIIVTASRRIESIQDAPVSMVSVDPEDFIFSGLTSVQDVIDYTPGVNFNSGGASGTGNITMRSVTQEGFIPVTAIYVDDVPITTSTPFANGAGTLLDGMLGDLERVEIIKGPQGTLYGASAVGGIVRYITKDPSLDDVRGNLSVDLSQTKEGGTGKTYRGLISMPLVEDKIGLTLGGYYNDEDGYIDRYDLTSLELVEENYNTTEVLGINATVLFQFSENSKLKIGGLYQKNETPGSSKVNLPITDFSNDIAVIGQSEHKYGILAPDAGTTETENQTINATFKYNFGWAEFTSVTAFAEQEYLQVADIASAALLPLADFVVGSAPGTTQSIPLRIASSTEKVIQELRLSSAPSETLEWIAGFYYSKDKTTTTEYITAEPQSLLINGSSFPAEYEEKAVYANATYYINKDFDVTAGLRHSQPSLKSDFDFAGAFVSDFAATFDVAEDVTTYLLNARYRVNDDLSIYSRVASGYRPAYVNIPLQDAITGQIASAVVDSDELWSYEVGAKGSALGNKFTYDIALWTMEWDEFQTTVVLNAANTGANADTSASSYGAEGNFQYYATQDLIFQANFALTESEIDEDSVAISAVAGEELRRLPSFTASFKASYYYELGSDIEASTVFGVRHTGKSNSAYIGDASRGIGFGLQRQFPSKASTLADLSTTFSKDDISLSLYVTNLFNEYDLAYGTASLDGLGNAAATAFVVQPRTVGITLGYSF